MVNAFVIADWGYNMYVKNKEGDDAMKNITWMDVLVNMTLAYTMVANSIILPVDLNIVVKEMLLEIFPPLLEGVDEDEMLQTDDLENEFSSDSTWWSRWMDWTSNE